MNKKRWLAVFLAIGLLIVSLVSDGLTSNLQGEKQVSGLNRLLYGNDELSSTVLEEGNSEEKIVKLTVEGTITNDGSAGLFSTEGYNHKKFLEQLDAIKEDDSIKGIFLEVNSPGGGVYESAEIAKELSEIRNDRKIPMYVSMKNTAASGGYYISAQADKIYATEETVTGSIGVIMSGLNYSGLLEKLGIEDTTVKSGALKDIGSSTRPQTQEEQVVLQAYIDNAYNRFVKVVSQGRHKSEEDVKKIADGRIYDGEQAKKVGLVDEIGYPKDALQAMRKEQGLKASETSQILTFLENQGTAESPKAMYYYGGE
ncbi:MAG: signal peptide peptidase SppA [Enterococcus lacertideformus]|uniref:Signal peptide peptidase SppA n=1 Tax=Enterococcus lacertideformus TaxID=2771493 RepID=A0A931B2Q8_9ENTE|nr:signal peptide peptidase SppA [Enterococcus lacertideformus]